MVIPFNGCKPTIGKESDVREGQVFLFQLGVFLAHGGGVGEADGVFRFWGAGEGVEDQKSGCSGILATVLGEAGLKDGIDKLCIGGEGDPFKATVVLPSLLAVCIFPKVDLLRRGVTGEIVIGGHKASDECPIGFELEDRGVVFFRDKEGSVRHEGKAFGVEATAAVLHPGFRVGGIRDEAGERISVRISVKVHRGWLCRRKGGGEDGSDRFDGVPVRLEGNGVESGGEIDFAVARSAVGCEIKERGFMVVGDAGTEATRAVSKRIDGRGGDRSNQFELGGSDCR